MPLPFGIVAATIALGLPQHNDAVKRPSPINADPSRSWLSYALFEAGTGHTITLMNATAVVPEKPTAVGADPSFWYGLQTARGDGALVQPILAWGQTYRSEYGMFHEVFDWNDMHDSRSPEAYKVSPGDLLTQSVKYLAASHSYEMYIASANTGKSITWTYKLERAQRANESTAYIVVEHQPRSCDMFPASGGITFSDIHIEVDYKPVRKPAWRAEQEKPACGSKAVLLDQTTIRLEWDTTAVTAADEFKASTAAAGKALAEAPTAAPDASAVLSLKLRQQHMSTIGRQEWLADNTLSRWRPAETALVVVDMWDKHWCASATTRVAELATPMEEFVEAARSAGITIIWAPSDVTSFYDGTAPRNNTLALPRAVLPTAKALPVPPMPLSTATDGGCDTVCQQRRAWSRQIATLKLAPTDYLIASTDPGGTQELWNVLTHEGIRNLLYVGVHENMCILNRPFAIEKVRSLGWPASRVAVVRELVDVMYTPKDAPYVSHADGLRLHTEYVEKFWASSVSMYDVLAPQYPRAERV